MQRLTTRIAQLRRELDPKAQGDRLRAAIDKVSAGTANYARQLQLEHASENVKLNLRELTLQFSPLSGRTDFLWEAGSGQNWVGYHIAGMLALHEHFLGMHDSPVANFLVIDQPSQVYFPEAWPSMEQTPKALSEADRSPDIEGVHRILSTLSAFLSAVSAQFQIIVTEHAGSTCGPKRLPQLNAPVPSRFRRLTFDTPLRYRLMRRRKDSSCSWILDRFSVQAGVA
jgi:hypothetical protein